MASYLQKRYFRLFISSSNIKEKDNMSNDNNKPSNINAISEKEVYKNDTHLYVSFDDSSDPTYASLDGCSLVLGTKDCSDNPCKKDNLIDEVSLVPQNHEEMVKFCELMGYDYEHDANGQLIITTGMYSSDDDHYDGYTRVD